MGHGNKVNHLGRKTAHRTSVLADMTRSLVEHKRINTTLAKAEALKISVEPLAIKSENDITRNHRVAFSKLHDKYAAAESSKEVVTKVGNRSGRYTCIIKLGNRLGDNAGMTLIEFVDYNTTYNVARVVKRETTRRGRKKATAEEVTQPVQTTEAAAE